MQRMNEGAFPLVHPCVATLLSGHYRVITPAK